MAPLATASELNTYLQRTVPGPLADLLLASASGAVRAYCRWDISLATETLYAIGDGTRLLSLPTLHLIEVDTITIDGVEADMTDPKIIWSRTGQLYIWGTWTSLAKVEVTCTHGWDPVPDLVRLVTLTMAARALNNPEGLKTATTGAVTRQWDTSMTDLHMRLLDHYRL